MMYKFKKRIHKIFRWNVPIALPSEMFDHNPDEMTWEKWRSQNKSKYPIRFFICETIPEEIGIIARKVNDFIYWIESHTFRKYHLLDMRQPKRSYYNYRYGYRDVVEKIIFANFNLLSEYIEKEMGGLSAAEEILRQLKEEIEDVSPAQINNLEKAVELYKWWGNDLPAMHNIYSGTLNLYSRNLTKEEKDKLYDQIWKLECEIDNTINLKLKELIDIRTGLWT